MSVLLKIIKPDPSLLGDSNEVTNGVLEICTGIIIVFCILFFTSLCVWIFYTIWMQEKGHSAPFDEEKQGSILDLQNIERNKQQ